MRTTRAEAIAAARAEERAAGEQLLRVVTHEMRTPMQAIRGWVGLLRDPNLAEPTRALSLDMIDQETQRLAWVMQDVSQQVDLENGRLVIVPSPAAPDQIVMAAAQCADEIFGDRTLTLNLAPDLAKVAVDAVLAQNIVFTLLRNACRYTAGPVHVELVSDPAGGARVAVRDTGPAFPAELHQVLFERLMELPDKHGKWPRAGLGLGLFVAREVARRMGGELWLEEGPGAGNDFCLRLPAAKEEGCAC